MPYRDVPRARLSFGSADGSTTVVRVGKFSVQTVPSTGLPFPMESCSKQYDYADPVIRTFVARWLHQPSTSGSVIVNSVSSSSNNNQHISNSMNGNILPATKQHNASSSSSVNHMVGSSNGVAVALMTSINTATMGCVPNSNCKQVVASVASSSCSASANSGTDRGACKATTATN